LRAFEAAARLSSFSAAADELGVTAGAISQHIRTLEDWTAVPLFERRSQGVRLSSAGRRLQPDFTRAFDAMGAAVRNLRGQSANRTVTIAALPSVAQLWVQPRLGLLRAALPDVNLAVTVVETPPNLNRELFDVTIYMRDPADCPQGVLLSRDFLTPVCSPALAERLHQPTDLNTATLLHDEAWSDDWRRWASSAGVHLERIDDGPRFSLYSMAIAEAKAGAGVLIGHTALHALLLKSGELVQPFQREAPNNNSLIAEVAAGPNADALRHFLQEQAE